MNKVIDKMDTIEIFYFLVCAQLMPVYITLFSIGIFYSDFRIFGAGIICGLVNIFIASYMVYRRNKIQS